MRSSHSVALLLRLTPSPRTLLALELTKFKRRVRGAARHSTVFEDSSTCSEMRSSPNRRSNHDVPEAPSRTNIVAAMIPTVASSETLTVQNVSGTLFAGVKEAALIAV